MNICMKLAQMVGIQVPEVEIITIQGHHFYAIKRYDREYGEEGITRLHQEDLPVAQYSSQSKVSK